MTIAAEIEGKCPLQEEHQEAQQADENLIEFPDLAVRQLAALRHLLVKQPAQRDQEPGVNQGEPDRKKQFAFAAARHDQVFPDDRPNTTKEPDVRERSGVSSSANLDTPSALPKPEPLFRRARRCCLRCFKNVALEPQQQPKARSRGASKQAEIE